MDDRFTVAFILVPIPPCISIMDAGIKLGNSQQKCMCPFAKWHRAITFCKTLFISQLLFEKLAWGLVKNNQLLFVMRKLQSINWTYSFGHCNVVWQLVKNPLVIPSMQSKQKRIAFIPSHLPSTKKQIKFHEYSVYIKDRGKESWRGWSVCWRYPLDKKCCLWFLSLLMV